MNDKPFVPSRHFRLPFTRRIEKVVSSLSLTGKIFLGSLIALFSVSSIAMLLQVNSAYMVEIPSRGGRITEGVVGLPRFINPLLSVTDGDKDLSALVYSGLLRINPTGEFVPDLAETYSVSADGKVYSFKLRNTAVFHDGTPVTADDVLFTISKAQDPAIKSNKRANWDGVVVEKISDLEVKFTLKQPFAAFIENTTMGILPQHLWQGAEGESFIASDLNVEPIGSGPYKIGSVERNDNGVPMAYDLEAFDRYVRGTPYIKTLVVKFYTSEKSMIDAFKAGDVDNINSISPDVAADLKVAGKTVTTGSLPRVFAVFFNQEANKALAELEVRQALNMSIDRDAIINSTLHGFGTALDSAAPKSFTSDIDSPRDPLYTSASLNEAITLLEKNGWTLTTEGIREKKIGKDTVPLSFSISTSDAPELKDVAEKVKTEWQKLGAQVSVKVIEGGYLNQNVIKPRKYDALLFGQVVNRELDLYAFWHSKERQDPGLNVAMYQNTKADKALEMIRQIPDRATRLDVYKGFDEEIRKDIPAVFLYSPSFIYVTSPNIKGLQLNQVSSPSERFSTILDWYIGTDKVWEVFTSK
ncbi:MAG: peptide ABC transporter substrate-binding protein [Patescibacteria group bacterium]